MNAASQAALAPLSIRKIRREVTTAAARCNGLPGNAACCSDASPGPGSWWVGAWLATFAPPPSSLPPRPPSVWAGPAKEENERNTTLRGRREARGEERVSAEWCESEWKTEKVREEREVPF